MAPQTRAVIYSAIANTIATRNVPSLPIELWNEFFKTAEEQRVLPFIADCFSSNAADLPAPVGERVARILRESRQNAFWFSAELKGLLAAMAAAAIDIIPLKGPYYSQRVYGGTHLRPTRDLDILVRCSQLAAARQLLSDLRFELQKLTASTTSLGGERAQR